MIFRQLFDKESSTYTYILADIGSHEALIIDPVLGCVDRDLQVLEELDLKLKYSIDTHVHADHITGASYLKDHTQSQTAVGKEAEVLCADLKLQDGDHITIGSISLKALATPGHTDGCMSYLVNDTILFTGDALLIRGTGRTDFQNGSAQKLYESIQEKIYTLPSSVIIYPGHDYKGWTCTTVGEEKKHNPRIRPEIKLEDFIHTMKNLTLGLPKKIHEAVPANLNCGKIN